MRFILFIGLIIGVCILGVIGGAITARNMLLNNYCTNKKMIYTVVKDEFYCKENNPILGERLIKIKWAKFNKDDKQNTK